MSDKNISKFISLILRHRPETIDITLDGHGWADVAELIAGMSKTHPLDMEDLERQLKNVPENRGCLIVTDGVFSMGGDIAKLPEIVKDRVCGVLESIGS